MAQAHQRVVGEVQAQLPAPGHVGGAEPLEPPAHEIVGRAVRHAIARGRELADLPLEELRALSPLIGRDVYPVLTVNASLRARAVIGGTAPEAVRQQLAHAKALLARDAGP